MRKASMHTRYNLCLHLRLSFPIAADLNRSRSRARTSPADQSRAQNVILPRHEAFFWSLPDLASHDCLPTVTPSLPRSPKKITKLKKNACLRRLPPASSSFLRFRPRPEALRSQLASPPRTPILLHPSTARFFFLLHYRSVDATHHERSRRPSNHVLRANSRLAASGRPIFRAKRAVHSQLYKPASRSLYIVISTYFSHHL